MAFIQTIELTTTRIDEIDALMQDWLAQTEGRRTGQRGSFTQDRDRPNTYVQIVEFPSYEAAMANSNLPETAAFAEQIAKLCDAPPAFRNLDVRRVDQL
jgi:quinol monooxygenase YgiN